MSPSSLRIHSEAAAEVPEAATQSRRDRREQARAAREQARRRAAFEALPQEQLDSLITQKGDSLEGRGADTIARDTVKEKKPQKPGAFLDDPISGKNKDSLVYDVRNKMVYIYNEGDITYQNRRSRRLWVAASGTSAAASEWIRRESDRRWRRLSSAAEASIPRGTDEPNTNWAKRRSAAAENRYFTLILSKIPIIFRTFADMSAKTPGSGPRCTPAGFFRRDKDR